MDLVVMAAGLGTRFGGLKQLAPVGPNGEAIVDYAGAWASAAGFQRAVVIVRSEIQHTIADHLANSWPSSFPYVLVCQDQEKRVQDLARHKPLGTAHAVVAVRDEVDGPFAVVNADDLYAEDSYGLLADHLKKASGSEHALVAFEVANTLIGPRLVTRALCRTESDGRLIEVLEGKVDPSSEPLTFRRGDTTIDLEGTELVSVNMWGFMPSIFGVLERAVDEFLAAGGGESEDEVLLPEVVNTMVGTGDGSCQVLASSGLCIGVTHADDLEILREKAAGLRAWS